MNSSVEYLSSPAALDSLHADAYWPKWNSPWWHMLLLHECGEAKRIPAIALEAFVEALERYPLKIFPIHPPDMPAGLDPFRDTLCHCAVGSAYQVLVAAGVDPGVRLPWLHDWILRYQMVDGGLTCDNEAYLVKDEVLSSMVGTIAPFEAILNSPRPWTDADIRFLDRAADFLMVRQLHLGSPTKHNFPERESAKKWGQLCFPRFYFYDVLRGLSALLSWAEKREKKIPWSALAHVVTHLETRFPGGEMYPERFSFEGVGTIDVDAKGIWTRGHKASHFPLMDEVSTLRQPNLWLTKQWNEAQIRLSKQGLKPS